MKFARSLFLLPLVLLSGLVPAVSRTGQESSTRHDVDAAIVETARTVDELLKENEFEGAFIIANGDRQILAKGYGFADREREIPATTETAYWCASIAKNFTAAAVMTLIDQGKIRLNDPIVDHVEVNQGTFRSDLFYRLSVFPIEAPPLRNRREDIPLLVSYFATNFAATLGKTIHSISKKSMETLEAYEWPGNVRELRNVVERSAILSRSDVLEVQEFFGNVSVTASSSKSGLNQDLKDVERARIVRALKESDGKIKGDGSAASRLGLSPSTLRSRMKRLEITRP